MIDTLAGLGSFLTGEHEDQSLQGFRLGVYAVGALLLIVGLVGLVTGSR